MQCERPNKWSNIKKALSHTAKHTDRFSNHHTRVHAYSRHVQLFRVGKMWMPMDEIKFLDKQYTYTEHINKSIQWPTVLNVVYWWFTTKVQRSKTRLMKSSSCLTPSGDTFTIFTERLLVCSVKTKQSFKPIHARSLSMQYLNFKYNIHFSLSLVAIQHNEMAS